MNSAVIYCQPKHIKKARVLTVELGFNIAKVFLKSNSSSSSTQLEEIMDYMEKNSIQYVIVDKCLTLSTKISEFLDSIYLMIKNGVSLVILDYKLKAITKGVINPKFRIIIEVLTDFDNIYQRKLKLKMEKAHVGFQSYLAAGGKVGRRVKNLSEYKEEYAEQIRLLKLGVSIKHCSKLTSTSINTLKKLKRMFG